MADRPILFSAPMVCALLAGTKTQTRRGLKPQPELYSEGRWHVFGPGGGVAGVCTDDVPEAAIDFVRIQPSDRLWVRESLAAASNDQGVRWLSYAADGKDVWPLFQWAKERNSVPSIHMPRWASRLTLIVTDVRVQRLQDISEEDARAEGIANAPHGHWKCYGATPKPFRGAAPTVLSHGRGVVSAGATHSYATLWDSINGPGSWEANPWVSAVTFTVHHQNIDQIEADHG